jgi:N-methylhydantoinase A
VRAAAGIVDVVTTARLSEIRKLLVEHGLDARDFSLVAFGGAGPVHAARLLRELGLRSVIVPPHPGLASAFGALTGDLRRDHLRTVGEAIDQLSMKWLGELCAGLRREAEAALAEEGVPASGVEVELHADMKYAGQLQETAVALPPLRFVDSEREQLKRAFYDEHQRLYSYALEDETVTLVNLRLVAHHRLPAPTLPSPPGGGPNPDAAFKGVRVVHFGGGAVRTRIFDRARLRPGNRVSGPAVVEEYDATTVVLPTQLCELDRHGNLVITLVEAAE